MRPDPRVGALTHVRRWQWGPWWLWSIVMILAAGAGSAGRLLLDAQQDLAQLESARALLAANRDRLQADHMQLKRQLEESRDAETKLDADLRRTRADGDRVSTLVGKLQKRVTSLQSELDAARAGAAESQRKVETIEAEARSAKEAAVEVAAKLQERVAELEAERNAARAEVERLTAEAARAAERQAEIEREVAQLKSTLEAAKVAPVPAVTGTTAPAPAP